MLARRRLLGLASFQGDGGATGNSWSTEKASRKNETSVNPTAEPGKLKEWRRPSCRSTVVMRMIIEHLRSWAQNVVELALGFIHVLCISL